MSEETEVGALSAYVNAAPGDEYVAQAAATARCLVDKACKGSTVPPDVYRQAFLEVGANLYQRRNHTRDAGNALELDGPPTFFRPALDPMTPAWPLLRPYLTPGIA